MLSRFFLCMSPCRSVVAAVVIVFLGSSLSHAKHEAWIEVRSANFVVVSNAGEKQARKAALQCEQIRAVFRQSIAVAKEHPSPFVTVLAAKDENTMRELLPEYWVKGRAHPAGLFASRLNNYQAAVQLDAPGSNPYETFYHEYYHSITVPYYPDLPVWVAEGLAEFFGHTQIEDKYVGMGQADNDLLRELNQQPLIPLRVLFNVDQSSPYYNEANRTSIFYAESWALTHYLMVGDRQGHRAVLAAYLEALEHGKSQDEAAATAFGDLNKLQNILQVYVRQAIFFYLKMAPPQIAEEELKVRTLSDAEAAAYRGGFAAVRGRTQEATATLQEALQLDPNAALAHQYLAMAEMLDGQRDKARASASQAVTLDPNNYFSRYLRAFIATSGSAINSADASVEEDLRQAIALNPDFSPPYALLGLYLAVRTEHVEEGLSFEQKAVAFEPASSAYQLSLAQVLARMNNFKDAGVAVVRAQAWARNPQEKTNAEGFASFLEQARRFRDLSGSDSPNHQATGASPVPRAALHLQMNLTVLSGPPAVGLRDYVGDVMGILRDRLLNSASQSSVKEPRNLSLEFAISKDGKVSDVKLASGSGNQVLDQSIRDAVSKASPFKAIPADWNAQTLSLRMDLAYSLGSADAQ